MEVSKTKIFKTNSFILKIIAIVTMIVDHLTVAFEPYISNNLYFAGRLIGRIAFPIFAYQIALGYKRTKNPWKYFIRLLILAVVSEVPFDLLVFETYFNLEYNNVLWTLAAGLLVLILTDELIKKLAIKSNALKFITGLLISFAIGYLCQYFHTDYGIMGVVLIYLFYAGSTFGKCIHCNSHSSIGTSSGSSHVSTSYCRGRRHKGKEFTQGLYLCSLPRPLCHWGST